MSVWWMEISIDPNKPDYQIANCSSSHHEDKSSQHDKSVVFLFLSSVYMYMWCCKVIGSRLPEDQKENLILKNYDNDEAFNPLTL